MVGGSSYIPAVWELVADALDTEPHMSLNPEEVVALGAGVQAAIIAGEPIDAILVDVTPHSLGIAVAQPFMGELISDRYKVLIRRNTTIPTTKEEEFYTVYPDQDTIRIEVYQGEYPVASDNTPLGEFLITDLEPEKPGDLSAITVQFDFDVNGMLKVTARDRKTNRQEAITVEASLARLSEAEILSAQKWADQEVLSQVALSDEMRILVERAQKLLDGETLSDEDRQKLETLMSGIDEAQEIGDEEDLDELGPSLLDLLFDLDN
jgi:molecular chaperone DnaK